MSRLIGKKSTALTFLVLAIHLFIPACSEKIKPGEVDVERKKGGPVEVAAVSLISKGRSYTAAGTVRARNSATLSPQIMGRITGVYAREGEMVKEGTLLVTIDDSLMQANVRVAEGMLEEAEREKEEVEAAIGQAESEVELAEKTYNRFKSLFEKKIVSQQEFDEVTAEYEIAKRRHDIALSRRKQVEAKVAQARASLQNSRIMLGYANVVAPFDGVVARKYLDPGSVAAPGTPLILLEEVGNFRLEVSLPEGYAGTVGEGSPCRVNIDAAGVREVKLAVREIVPGLDPATRSFTAKIDLPRKEGIRSGMFGRATFSVGEDKVVAVPEEALVRVGGYQGIYVVTEENLSRFSMVKTGEQFEGMVEILSGLRAGQLVIVSGTDRVSDGDVVEVKR